MNPLERMKSKQIRVARHDMCRLPTDCEGKELVIFWVAASSYLNCGVYPFGFSCEGREKAPNVFLVDITTELFTVQDLEQLGESWI